MHRKVTAGNASKSWELICNPMLVIFAKKIRISFQLLSLSKSKKKDEVSIISLHSNRFVILHVRNSIFRVVPNLTASQGIPNMTSEAESQRLFLEVSTKRGVEFES